MPIKNVPAVKSVRKSDLAATIMFFSSDVLDSDAMNLVDFFKEAVSGVFVETDTFFRFRINPSHLTVRKNKLISKTFTKTGYNFSHHGNDVTMLGYRGTTGFFEQPNAAQMIAEIAKAVPGFPAKTADALKLRDEIASLVLSGQWNITMSPVWQKFRRFEAFWDRIQAEMLVYYDLRLYRGEVTSFSYVEDANDPFQIKYEFSFEAHTDSATGVDRRGRALIHMGVR